MLFYPALGKIVTWQFKKSETSEKERLAKYEMTQEAGDKVQIFVVTGPCPTTLVDATFI